MRGPKCWLLALASSTVILPGCAAPATKATEADVRRALQATSGVVRLPHGEIEISAELVVSPQARSLKILGDPEGTVLRAASSFQGDAVLVLRSGTGIELAGFQIDGNREALERPIGLPPANVAFADFYENNGIVAAGVTDLAISDLDIRNVANFAILVARSSQVRIERVQVSHSGSRYPNGRNNTSGGILLEEGTTDFRVENSRIENVRGNGVWTHSWYGSPRNLRGRIEGNYFEQLARDAVQVGHGVDVAVVGNSGRSIGYPAEEVDAEGGGFPVAIDTAGDVEHSVYAENRFEEVDGKCVDLDGFHHGEVRANVCINRGAPESYPFGNYGIAMNNTNPDMRSEFITIRGNTMDGFLYGGLLLIGSNHRIENNRFINLNQARCNDNRTRCSYRTDREPDFLRSGIYLAGGAERPDPARENRIENNEITGYGMERYCVVAAPGVRRDTNQILSNRCADAEPRR
jgi:hypothetical protein